MIEVIQKKHTTKKYYKYKGINSLSEIIKLLGKDIFVTIEDVNKKRGGKEQNSVLNLLKEVFKN